ncbi:hypothetical protein N665_0081s0067 [Sinapis alba]|nr:hypothetical protein N665_0081s0067 [Sinapis alba]
MSSVRSEQRFTHIHPLTKVNDSGGFICNGCKTHGSGTTYGCSSCDYDLHEYCAKCPLTLLSFLHPQHELQLVVNPPDHYCDLCQGLVEGFYYRCEACDFDLHPLCTQKPKNVSTHTHKCKGPSKRKRVFKILKRLTVHVVYHILTEM